MKTKLKTTYLKYPSFEDVNMLDEYVEEYKKMFPNYHAVSRENYKEHLRVWEEHRKGIGTNGVFNNFCWIIDNNKIIGLCTFNINPEVDEKFRMYGGHISYSIHPKYRNQGYGTIACHLLIKKCLEFGIEEVMITCYDWNSPSKKVIENNFGILKDKIENKNEINCRYLINTKQSIKKFEEKLLKKLWK
jgi:predicted acetyltransferase